MSATSASTDAASQLNKSIACLLRLKGEAELEEPEQGEEAGWLFYNFQLN